MTAAAAAPNPNLLLPYHWELWRGRTSDPLELGRLLERRKPIFGVWPLQLGDHPHYRPGGNVGIVSAADPDQVLKWIEKGMWFITLDCDDAFLLQASQAAVERARAILGKRIVP